MAKGEVRIERMKVFKIGGRGQLGVTIPVGLCRVFRIQEGQEVTLVAVGNKGRIKLVYSLDLDIPKRAKGHIKDILAYPCFNDPIITEALREIE